jgi:carotenoid cleavage dioxygenase-like enzyme
VTELSRRDMLRAAAMGALGLSMPALVAACGGKGSSDRVIGSKPTTPPTTEPFDPSRPWWLQGNFAPVMREVEAFDLEVVGAIPPELAGLYVRNGSNPQSGDSSHWFFGDGMVHGVRLANGKAEWYRNRYVRTKLYTDHSGFGDSGAPGGSTTQSNVSAFAHAGKLLTSGEVGYPYELNAGDLSTQGLYDFDGKLKTACTAHPKIDPVTGNLHFFGYGFTPPFLTYHVADADGRLVSSQEVPVVRSTMIHDFAITDRDAVFWELPVVFDLVAATKWIQDPHSGVFPYQWRPDVGARIGVMPLGGPASSIEWYEIDPCYVFHGVNAFRDADNVVLDVCRLTSMFAKDQTFGGDLSLRRWTVDTASGKVRDEVVDERGLGELPTRDPRRVGRRHRYGYFVQTRDVVETVEFGGLIKHDYERGTREIWEPGPNVHAGEWLFVPSGTDPADDAGYLLTFAYDAGTDRSHLLIVDASAVRAGPVARIALPQRVPYGFHATWVSA